jgi:MarR family transcriptional regulator, organic hydroperoxide resistance regulator
MYQFTTAFTYLVNKVGSRLWELFSRDLAPYGVTVPMYRVLAALNEKGDQQLGALSAMTTVELSTLSRLVSLLKRRGLVSRVRIETDERSIRINLTAKGRALAPQLIQIAARHEDWAGRALGEKDMEVVRRSLAIVLNNLDGLDREIDSSAALSLSHRDNPRNREPRRRAR